MMIGLYVIIMTYITGDTHGRFERIKEFCNEQKTTNEDVMIILGDVGINYYLDKRDDYLREEVAKLPITLFGIHGNHEERPYNIEGYEEESIRRLFDLILEKKDKFDMDNIFTIIYPVNFNALDKLFAQLKIDDDEITTEVKKGLNKEERDMDHSIWQHSTAIIEIHLLKDI